MAYERKYNSSGNRNFKEKRHSKLVKLVPLRCHQELVLSIFLFVILSVGFTKASIRMAVSFPGTIFRCVRVCQSPGEEKYIS